MRRAIPLGAAILCALAEPAPATTLLSTRLRDLAALTDAVIQGQVADKKNLVDRYGVPWTIYTMSVEKMLAGGFAGKEFSFRCLGGESGGRVLVMSGAPQFAVGDSIVLFHTSLDENCQVAGYDHGAFLLRSTPDGEQRVVNPQGRSVASIGPDGPIFSDEVILSKDPNAATVESAKSIVSEPEPSNRPPPGDASIILDELAAFVSANVRHASPAVASTNDLTGIMQTGELVSQGGERK